MLKEIIETTKKNMEKAEVALKEDLAKFRTGRANPSLVKDLRVPYYGTPTPLFQIATIATPDPKSISIMPFDKTAIGEIEKTIQKSDLGINPVVDGQQIRLNFPQLTEERRKDLVKQMKKKLEDARVAIRNHRRAALDACKKAVDDGEPEDGVKKTEADVQKITDEFVKRVDKIGADKEKDIMTT